MILIYLCFFAQEICLVGDGPQHVPFCSNLRAGNPQDVCLDVSWHVVRCFCVAFQGSARRLHARNEAAKAADRRPGRYGRHRVCRQASEVLSFFVVFLCCRYSQPSGIILGVLVHFLRFMPAPPSLVLFCITHGGIKYLLLVSFRRISVCNAFARLQQNMNPAYRPPLQDSNPGPP